MGRKNGVCLGRCMCSRNHGGNKVICKKMKLKRVAAFSGTLSLNFEKKGK